MKLELSRWARILRLLVLGGACVVAFAQTASADTELFNTGYWVVVGAIDPGPAPRDIAVSIDGVPAGSYSELKLYYPFTGAGVPQIFSITGRGAIRPSLPPPGEFGGAFWLTSYWDCSLGEVPSLVITELNLVVDAKNPKVLNFEGAVSNLTSFEATDLLLKFPSPNFNDVKVEVSYKLVATRDFCVDASRQAQNQGFQAARMQANYLSSDEKDNDYLRYRARLTACDWYGCYGATGSVCGSLHNDDPQLVCFDDRLADAGLMLVHQSPYPRNTPTLKIDFNKPKYKKMNPQGFVAPASDPDEENVNIWGNWRSAKSSYKAGKKVGKFAFTMKALTPETISCNAGACY